ncbi:MAG TPA: adenosine deaminase [Anaerolineaceae bacterium]|nr:adenosine deaminase [Anaerolineaceae bacterium]
MSSLPAPTDTFFVQLPKVELHRHLEGTLRLKTMLDIARTHGITLPMEQHLRALVQMQPDEPFTFSNFLSKFQTLRLFYRSPEAIARVTREAIEDAARDQVVYLELRFTPVALSRAEDFPLADVMDWVCDAAREGEQATGLTTRLIASVNRHENPSLAEKVARLAAERQSRGICGLDLAGNEVEFSARPFMGIFREARESGLHITVHAGEWRGADNVREAIEDIGAERIAHGVRVLEDPEVVALARDLGTPFEVCITSNYQTGVFPTLRQHPLLSMLNQGLNVTINTDDPSISQITLSNEYCLACQELGLTTAQLHGRILAAAQAAFLAEDDRRALIERLEQVLATQG